MKGKMTIQTTTMQSKNKNTEILGVLDANGFETSNARRVVNASKGTSPTILARDYKDPIRILTKVNSDYQRDKTFPCKLDKMPEGTLTSLNNATICDIGTKVASTVTSRYFKGIGGHKDNMVLEVWKKHLT